MPHAVAVCHTAKLDTLRPMENSTRGGSSDTELNELTVIPCSDPSLPRVAATTTPVGKAPSALRNSPHVNAIGQSKCAPCQLCPVPSVHRPKCAPCQG